MVLVIFYSPLWVSFKNIITPIECDLKAARFYLLSSTSITNSIIFLFKYQRCCILLLSHSPIAFRG